jgi:hypothetical protein
LLRGKNCPFENSCIGVPFGVCLLAVRLVTSSSTRRRAMDPTKTLLQNEFLL